MAETPLAYFGFSCPRGGKFYICEGNSTEFFGCCDSNPCDDGSGECPDSDIRTATFSPDTYAELPTQDCTDKDHEWYTCAYTNPPFVGCCAENPCGDPNAGGCATKDLGGVKLAPEGAVDEARRMGLLHPAGAGTGTGTEEGQKATTASSAGPGVSGTAGAEEVGSGSGTGSGGGLGTGAIVGIVVGCCAVIMVLVAILFFKCGWTARKKRHSQPPEGMSTQGQYPPMGESYAGEGYSHPSPALPSPYQASINSSVTAVPYGQDALYPKQYSPHNTPSFHRPVSIDSHDWGQSLNHGHAQRRHQSQLGGLGVVAMMPVQELDSRGVEPPNELSAGHDARAYRAYSPGEEGEVGGVVVEGGREGDGDGDGGQKDGDGDEGRKDGDGVERRGIQV